MPIAQTKRGFTIVELLIVIVVIGILAAITIVAYNGIQSRARDTDRSSDISSLQKKLEIFYSINGYYPSSGDMTNETYRTTTLDIPTAIVQPPNGSPIAYCWATQTNLYCYVAARAAGLTGDCIAATEKCIKYTISYMLENKAGVQYANSSTKRGFTIVELLIVIVVIGILAAITIVAYNGIQQRAKNASRTSSAQQASKLIRAYYAEKGNYPFDGTTCVTDTCTDYAGTAEAASRTILLANLKTIGNPPTKSAAAGKYYGIWYNTRAAGASYDGDSSKPVILMMYWLDGQSQNCGLDNIAIQGTGEAWQRSPNRWSYNDSAENATACWVSV